MSKDLLLFSLTRKSQGFNLRINLLFYWEWHLLIIMLTFGYKYDLELSELRMILHKDTIISLSEKIEYKYKH